MKNYLKIALLLVGTTTAIKLNAYFIGKAIDPLTTLVVSAVIAVILYKILELFLIEIPIRLKFFRYVLEPGWKMEGHWICTVPGLNERPYSFATIEYCPISSSIVYYGTGFDENGNICVSWKTTKSEVELKKRELKFFFESQLMDEEAEVIKGHGFLEFEKHGIGKYTRARGFFVDSGTNLQKQHTFLDRLEKEDFNRLINKNKVIKNDDMSKLIVAYHSERIGANQTLNSDG